MGDTSMANARALPGLPAWRSAASWCVLAGVAVVALAMDLSSKWAAFRFVAGVPVVVERGEVLAAVAAGRSPTSLLPPHRPVTVVPNLLDFSLVLNQGAVFGLGAGQRWWFVAFTVLALGFGVWMFAAWTRSRDRVAHAAIGLLLAGGLGNLYDRLIYACVRDFIHPLPGVMLPFGWRMPLSGGREVWPYVSNVADLWLLVGIGILMVFLWSSGKRTPSRPGNAALPPVI